ncbi:LuxR C-terminal-related transcriptional regulator [Hydrocarboniphaga sp.]|uniref:LuxR C-terminal-related transcriptional regulator n=1 Tax=Hydrocarboniphaga sp. TaxID=2033016 RepID=UPI003D0A4F59
MNPPRPDERLVSRRALFTRLTGNGRHGAVLGITAAAGSGKSTLMAQLYQLLEEGGTRTCWLSLDEDDDGAAAFAIYFLSALSAGDVPMAQQELASLRASPVRDFDSLFDALVQRLSTLRTDTAIFLDDFQHIRDARVLRFLNKLIAHLPRTLRLVIGSRSSLPLDLARLRVADELVEIDQDDLNFDRQQAVDFLKRYHELELTPVDLDTLLATTEGWPTGLQLAALALRRHRGPARELINSFSGHDKDLTSYLVESVLRTQPEGVRKFLLRTAPLRRMSAELCQATSGHPNSAEMLIHLERSHLFVIPLDRNGQWYRYHHLFAEFLQDEIRRSDPAAYQAVCDAAVQWCERNGQTTEAIQYALDGSRYDKASDLIADHGPRVSQHHGDHYTVLDWMRRLPEQYHGRRPEIALSHAWSRAFSRDTGRAMQLAEQVLLKLRDEAGGGWNLSDAERQRMRLWARVVQAVGQACADEIDECLERSTELRARLPESEPFLIASICNCLSYCRLVRREFDRSAAEAADAYAHGHRAGAVFATAMADFLHGLASVESGRLRDAQQCAQRTEESARAAGPSQVYVAGLSGLISAEIAIQRCDFAKARGSVAIGRAFAAIFGPVEPLVVAMRTEARVLAADGQLDAARQVLMQGQDTALSIGQSRLYLSLAIEEATLQLIAGDIAGAQATAQRAGLRERLQSPRASGVDRWLRDSLSLLEARLALAEGHAAPAVRRLTSLQQARNAEEHGGLPLAIRAVRALALWQCERHADAARELDRALSAAAPESHAYPLASAGIGLLPVLDAIAGRRTQLGIGGEMEARLKLHDRLCSVLRGDEPEAPSARAGAVESGVTEALTPREIELLRLVQTGLANRQLADTLLVSEGTVKWHLHNIYSKIGVRSRTAAAARARDLRLI